MEYMGDFMEARYHLAVAERMMKGYEEYPEKRFLVGVINEAARAVSKLIRAYMKADGSQRVGVLGLGVKKGRGSILKKFLKDVAPKYLDEKTCGNLVKVLEIERAQKISPVEFAKGDKIILLIRGEYRVLTADRIREFVKSVSDAVSVFSGNFRHV